MRFHHRRQWRARCEDAMRWQRAASATMVDVLLRARVLAIESRRREKKGKACPAQLIRDHQLTPRA